MTISPSPMVTPIGAKLARPASSSVVTMLSIIMALSKIPPPQLVFLDIFLAKEHREPRLHQLATQVKGVTDRFVAKVGLELVEDPADVGLLNEKIAIEHVYGLSVGIDSEVGVRHHPLHLTKLRLGWTIDPPVLDGEQTVVDILWQHPPPPGVMHQPPGQIQLSDGAPGPRGHLDRKSTRLNSSHHSISYAVFCLKKK